MPESYHMIIAETSKKYEDRLNTFFSPSNEQIQPKNVPTDFILLLLFICVADSPLATFHEAYRKCVNIGHTAEYV